MKILGLIIVLVTSGFLVYGTLDMPGWGDPESPASKHVSPYYITKTMEHTATPNIVTSVLADYRGFDTLGETAVIFAAGMACLLILRRRRKE
ncbi:hydrogen gas-evolving membrane-bound hydrogenase subunit E [Spirochaetota bacterium]